jgi:IclR family pca regulon transcriptional regulator
MVSRPRFAKGMHVSSTGDPDFMTSLARGLRVLSCFAEQRRPLTVANASLLAQLSKAATRRCLHTLVELGYAAQNGAYYTLLPKALTLGYAYLSSNDLPAIAQPLLDRICATLHESCSLGVRDGDELVYVGRSETQRIMSIALRVGSRLPLYCTSMGRVMLAAMSGDEQNAYLARAALTPRTEKTVTDPAKLRSIFAAVAEQGYAIVDQELETGLRSIAVPVAGKAGTIGAINIGLQSDRTSIDDLKARHLPVLQQASRELTLPGL